MGKFLSLSAKILACIFVLLTFLYLILKNNNITVEQTKSIIYIGTFFAMAFSPVDISFWLEKFVQIFGSNVNDKRGDSKND